MEEVIKLSKIRRRWNNDEPAKHTSRRLMKKTNAVEGRTQPGDDVAFTFQ